MGDRYSRQTRTLSGEEVYVTNATTQIGNRRRGNCTIGNARLVRLFGAVLHYAFTFTWLNNLAFTTADNTFSSPLTTTPRSYKLLSPSTHPFGAFSTFISTLPIGIYFPILLLTHSA